VTWIDTSGRVTAQRGEAGTGPGLLAGPTAVEIANGSIQVWDPRQGTIVGFASSGTASEIRLSGQLGSVSRAARTNLYGRPGLLRRAGSRWTVAGYAGAVSQHREQRSLSILRIDDDGRILDTVWRSTLPSPEASGSAVELLPIPVWDACPDGRIAVYDPAAQAVRLLRTPTSDAGFPVIADTVLVGRDGLLANTRLQVRRLLLEAHQAPPPSFEAMVAEATTQSVAQGLYPEYFTGYTALLCDPKGRIWLEEFSLADSPLGYGRTWRRFEGSHELAPVRLPPAFRLMRISAHRGYGIVLDSAAAEYPAWVTLPSD
jgi:hypothetical protein